jgi:hypothetical protein
MITVSKIEYDIDGSILIDENIAKTTYGSNSRRQNRVGTLDGGTILQDRGYAVGDMTFNITAKRYIQADFDRLQDLLTSQPVVRLSCREGTFIGTLKSLDSTNKKFDFLVIENG